MTDNDRKERPIRRALFFGASGFENMPLDLVNTA
jgi:hypothetical protein